MYNIEEEVIHFIFEAFAGTKRKNEDIDLVFHSISVGNMLKNIKCDEKTVLIGYLHDVIEDTKYNYDVLLVKYGIEIADGVQLLSEDKSIVNYVDRKKDFLIKLSEASDNLILVEIADKLHNLISDYELYNKNGKDILVVEANNYDELKWFYSELKELFNKRISNCELLDRYNKMMEIYFSNDF